VKDVIDSLLEEIRSQASALSTRDSLELFRNTYLARKGKVAALFDAMKSLPNDEKPLAGKLLNALRVQAETLFNDANAAFNAAREASTQLTDYTLPGRPSFIGHQHIVTKTIDDIKTIFKGMGFSVATGPELETDYYNFGSLNFADDHPARDMQDTFFIDKDILLRTHTSPVQTRVMEQHKLPIRVVIPGKVYRNEVVSARSHMQFHQVEGLYIDKGVTFADLKGTLVSFAKQYYGSSLKYIFRASYFPFTEPSAELDITCYLCGGKGCRVCKHTGWLEILGCGMVDPNVLSGSGIDPEVYSGFAFGMGVERTAMLLHGLDDIRHLLDNDLRINSQFY